MPGEQGKEGERVDPRAARARRRSTVLLAVVAVLSLGAAAALVLDSYVLLEWLQTALHILAWGPGAALAGGVAGLGLMVGVWALVRPRDGARFAVMVPALMAAAAFVVARLGSAGPPGDATLGDRATSTATALAHADAAAGAGLFAASLAASVAGLALALRARSLAKKGPRLTARAWLVPVVVLAATLVALVWVLHHGSQPHVLLLQSALAGVTALAAATALGREEDAPAERDAVAAGAMSLLAMSLGIVSIAVRIVLDYRSSTGHAEDLVGEMWRTFGHDGRVGARYLLPALAALAVGGRWRGTAARAAARELAGPLLGVLVATLAVLSSVRSAAVSASLRGLGAGLEALDPRLLAASCDGVRPSALVRASASGLQLPDGPAGADAEAAFARLETRAPDDDLDVALASDATPFHDLGELFAAAGRARGPRGLVLASTLIEPARGCAVVLVGRGAEDTLTCTGPMPLAAPGCMPGRSDETPLEIALAAGQVTLAARGGAWTRRGALADLGKLTADAYALFGEHRSSMDWRFDHAILRVEAAAPLRDVVAALTAMATVQRDYADASSGRSERRPAFIPSLALAGASAR